MLLDVAVTETGVSNDGADDGYTHEVNRKPFRNCSMEYIEWRKVVERRELGWFFEPISEATEAGDYVTAKADSYRNDHRDAAAEAASRLQCESYPAETK